MQTKSGAILLALLSMAFLSGCGTGESLKGIGEGCTKTNECENGLACVGLTCVSEQPDGDTTEGDSADGDTAERDETDIADRDTTDDDARDGDSGDGEAADEDTTDDDTSDGDTSDDDTADDDITDSETAEWIPRDPRLTWVSIPAGTFQMGCVPQDINCPGYAKPRHSVTVSAFEMTDTEITQDQYYAITGERRSYFFGCGRDCPVEQVAPYHANLFCKAVGGRLPSEAEWEYAARAGTDAIWICGDDSSCLDDIAWWTNNSRGTTHPVAQKKANAFGLYDMTGNVWEWVADCWHDNYTDAPSTGGVWEGGDCESQVLRGGSWYYHEGLGPWPLSVSYRYGDFPIIFKDDIGFRCVRDVSRR